MGGDEIQFRFRRNIQLGSSPNWRTRTAEPRRFSMTVKAKAAPVRTNKDWRFLRSCMDRPIDAAGTKPLEPELARIRGSIIGGSRSGAELLHRKAWARSFRFSSNQMPRTDASDRGAVQGGLGLRSGILPEGRRQIESSFARPTQHVAKSSNCS